MLSRPGLPAPEYLVKRHRWAAAAWFTSLFFLVIAPPPLPPRIAQLTHFPGWSTLALFSLATVAYVTWSWRLRRSLRRQAEAAEFTLCTRCAYDISPLERSAPPQDYGKHIRCPECGTLFNAREARILWRACLTE